MGLYNFMPRFVPMIEDWSKRHTIRGERAHPDIPGDAMHNYTGLRHPGARCLMRPMCVRTEFIRIEGGPMRRFRIRMGASLSIGGGPDLSESVSVCGEPIYGSVTGGPLVTLSEDELQALAWRDGFRPEGSTLGNPGDAFGLMAAFWTRRLPFYGNIYHWNPARQLVPDPLLPRWRRWVDVPDPRAVDAGAAGTHDNGTYQARKQAPRSPHPSSNPPVISVPDHRSEKRGFSAISGRPEGV